MKFADVRKYVTGLLSASFVNKSILDNLAEDENENLTYKGAAIEGGGSGITELPIATTETIGGVIVGDGLSVDETGVLSALGSGSGDLAELPIATEDTLGGIIVGEGLDIDENGILSVINGGSTGGSDTIQTAGVFKYTGQGRYGVDNPTIIEFDTAPDTVFIRGGSIDNLVSATISRDDEGDIYSYYYYGQSFGVGTAIAHFSWENDGKTLKLWAESGDAGVQMDYSNRIYTVIYSTKVTGSIGGNSSGCNLKTFTYTGTGGYGSSNPTILTFESKPSLIFISGIGNNNNHLETTIRYKQDKYAFAYYGGKETACRWNQGSLIWEDDKTLKLVSTLDEGAQFNYLDAVYTVTYIEEGTSGNSSSAELPDNIVLYAEDEEVIELPSANSNKINYSLEEQVIGTWLDGKPLYQKTVYIESLPNTTQQTYSTEIYNLENIAYMWGMAGGSPILGRVEGSYTIEIHNGGITDNNESLIKIGTGIDRSGTSAYITVQYTKTTD